MSIYPSTKVLPYVYWLTHKVTNQFYIGYREANKIPSDLDLLIYQTSSKKIKELRFENFNYIIVGEFFTGDDAYNFEQRLIEENIKNPLCLNRHYIKDGKRKFSGNAGIPLSAEIRLKISIANKGKIRSSETRKKISIGATGVLKTLETRKKLSISNKGKIRSLETRKKIGAWQIGRKLPLETCLKISKSHEGKKLSKEHKQKLSISGKGTTRPKSMYTPQWRQLQRESHLGRKDSPETFAKKSAAHSGENNPRAKTWVILKDDNSVFEVKALKPWCKSSNLNFDKLAKTRLTKEFYNGFRVLDKK